MKLSAPPHVAITLALFSFACVDIPGPDSLVATWDYTNLDAGVRPTLIGGVEQGACIEAREVSDYYQQYKVDLVELDGDGCFPDAVAVDYVSEDGATERNSGGWQDASPDATNNEGACNVPWEFLHADLQDLACADPGCGVGYWYVSVYPHLDQDFATCEDYDDAHLTLHMSLVDTKGVESAAADCSAGTGRFKLLPTGFTDLNNNGEGRYTYVPVQVSGSGTMTNRARVTAINVVDDEGYALRVLKANAAATFTGADLLNNASTVTYLLTGNHTFTAGAIRGTPVFLHPPVPASSIVVPVVDMSWDCGGSVGNYSYTQGYQIRSDTLGCGGKQKIVARYDGSEIRFEEYGNPIVYASGPVGAGGAFSVSYGGTTVTGSVLSANSTSMSLDLDSVSDGVLSYCTPGIYTLPVE